MQTKLLINADQKTDTPPTLLRAIEGDLEAYRLIPQSDTVKLSACSPSGVVSFYFSGAAPTEFVFRQGTYVHELPPQSVLLLFYPNRDATFDVVVAPAVPLFVVHLPLHAMHRLFSQNDHELHFLAPQNVDKEFFEQRIQNAGVLSALYQIHTSAGRGELESLFVISRTYEILYHHFSSGDGASGDKCPFLANEDNVERIRSAKRILHDELRDPPNISELARRVGMNQTHLKSGFKRIYGCPIYTWVIEQRLSMAHDLFRDGALNVNEVAERIGYANVSQFISAFKRRYGLTPGMFMRKVKHSTSVADQ